MKNWIVLSLLILIASACQKKETKTWTLVPYPNSVSYNHGVFTFNQGVTFSTSYSELDPIIVFYKDKFSNLGIDTNSESSRVIELTLADADKMKPEAYKLDIDSKRVKLTASDPGGIFYGLMTIWQEQKLSKDNTIPCGLVQDEPRFEYRGFMLDESRHFFGKEKVKQIIDLLSSFKLNTFHWHLTDAQGWRIEIKSLPKLAEIGGQGDYTNPSVGEAKYYTQDEIVEVVNYAKERFIQIIPEIDMPGHATAANRAYPEYSGGGSEKWPNFTFDVGREATYKHLNTILDEVAQLFPSKYIHLGGDEVHYGNEKWHTNDSIQSLMKREGFETLVDVEHYFAERMEKYLTMLDKGLAGWDEIVESDINNETALVYWWRHNKVEQLEKALAKEFQVVLCPRIPCYLDFVQHERDSVGRRGRNGIFNPVHSVYHYPDSTHSFSEKEAGLIKGIQGNLWTERVATEARVDYMIFPRIIALSESAWTKKENKNLSRFNENLPSVFEFLDEQGIYYFNSLNPDLREEVKR